jgi:hypothetical protein
MEEMQPFTNAIKWIVDKLRIRWVVITDNDYTETGELGLKIGPVILGYYKWPDPMVLLGHRYREANKREFGETIKTERSQ